MAFLDNSGDIILDAVLTDAGRARLAAGDGSFKITKFAFADDEIDYSKYDKNNINGTAYYAIDILSTPVFEAFTNNTSTMKSKLVSIAKNNLLYLPVVLFNETDGEPLNQVSTQAQNSFSVLVDETTDDVFEALSSDNRQGVFFAVKNTNKFVQLDQGLDTTEISKNQSLDPSLVETHYIIEVDNRLGVLASPSNIAQPFSFLDDDNVATYNVANVADTQGFFAPLTAQTVGSPIDGPRGGAFRFKLKPSLELQTSNFLFTKLGSSGNTWNGASGTYSYIDSIVKVTGATTGYSINVPVRYVKKD
jgi:hypothetical protein